MKSIACFRWSVLHLCEPTYDMDFHMNQSIDEIYGVCIHENQPIDESMACVLC